MVWLGRAFLDRGLVADRPASGGRRRRRGRERAAPKRERGGEGGEGREAEAEQWYSRAEKAYKTIIAQRPGTRDEALALYFLADLHRQKKQWSEAATTLSQVFQKFPETIQGLRAASMAADVYRDKLGNTRTADSLEMAVEQAALARSTAAQ